MPKVSKDSGSAKATSAASRLNLRRVEHRRALVESKIPIMMCLSPYLQ